jgi:3-hydroxyacyl-CoA dehydrogenase
MDVGWNPKTTSSSTVQEIMCEAGRLGQKSGKGFYKYDEEGKKISESLKLNH